MFSFLICSLLLYKEKHELLYLINSECLCRVIHPNWQGFFFLGGLRVPPSGESFVTPSPPPPAEVRPRKFEKFKYIFVANLTTFKLKSTFKKLYFMLKIAKNGLILH